MDDSPTQAKQLLLILASAGFEVEVAGDGHQGLERLRQRSFDLVLSDVMMPGISGYELCEAIKKSPQLEHLPVLLLTALDNADDIMRGLASGADNYITKPYEPDYLLERVATVLANRESGVGRNTGQFHFMGRSYEVSSPREQILTFLTSTFEDYARGRQREKNALRVDMENKRKAAEALARKNSELLAANSKLEEVNSSLDVANRRLEASYDDLKRDQALREIELRRMEVELTTARTVQSMLIPDQPPQDIPGFEFAFSYQPAMETGGDWLGFVHYPAAHELQVMIGDVIGHGVGSALLTAGVFALISALRQGGRDGAAVDLEQTVTSINRVIMEMGRKEYSMTFFACRIHYDQLAVEFVNAGHPHPFLFRKSCFTDDLEGDARKRVLSLISRGSRLGDMDYVPQAPSKSQLERGDLIVWFTDGITENTNPAGEPIGERRVLRWLRELYGRPVEEVKTVLETRMKTFLDGHPPADDMAFILGQVL